MTVTLPPSIDLSDTKVVRFNDMAELLLEQVLKKPFGYVYEKVVCPSNDLDLNCVNWVKDPETGARTPSCVFGYALHDLGMLDGVDQGVGAIAAVDQLQQMVRNETGVWTPPPVVFTNAALALAVNAQSSQDGGKPWSTAVVRAIRESAYSVARLEASSSKDGSPHSGYVYSDRIFRILVGPNFVGHYTIDGTLFNGAATE